jgi:DnaK suppressor protein
MTTRNGLTPSQLAELRSELLAERSRLERSQAAHADADDALMVGGGDGGAYGMLGVAIDDRTQLQLEAVSEALDRIATGTYGTCAGCGEPIPYGRLLVMPEVTHCVLCSPRG